MKYFCPKCESITFALRFATGKGGWEKPLGSEQWCKNCKKAFPQRDCIKGLKDLERR